MIWSTGDDESIEARKGVLRGTNFATLSCDKEVIVRDAPILTAEEIFPPPVSARIGMKVLGRGSFTFDLPHGRLWFNPEGLKQPVRINRSGVSMRFGTEKGERVLRVVSMAPKGPSEKLLQAGLKPGMRISRIDSMPAEEMDLWDVNRRLAGELGATVTLEWPLKKSGVKIVPLEVR